MKRYEYVPGNGTRYEIAIIDNRIGQGFHPPIEHPAVYRENSFYFIWMRYGPASGVVAKFYYDSLLHYSYFEKKVGYTVGIGEADTAAILVFLERETGIQVAIPEGYDKNGLYAGMTRTHPNPMID